MEIDDDKKLIRLFNSDSQSEDVLSESESQSHSHNLLKSETEWRSEERMCLLKVIEEHGYVSNLLENENQTYVELSKLMTVSGYNRSKDDIKAEWSKILLKYNEGTKFECYDELHKLLRDSKNGVAEIIIIEGDTFDEPENTDHTYEELAHQTRNSKKWSDSETCCLLEALDKYGLPTHRTLRKISSIAYKHMKENGYKRSLQQVQFRIKNLKSCYYKVERKVMRKAQFAFYGRMKDLFDDYKQTLSEEQLQKWLVLHGKDRNVHKSSESDGDETEEHCNVNGTPSLVRRQFWSDEETQTLLQFIKKKGIGTGDYY